MRIRLAFLAGLLVLIIGAAAAPAAQPAAGERILSYHSDITVHPDASLTVTETIKVRAEGKQIKRGIYRDFPVRYAGRDLSRVIVPFEILAVRRDGKSESWHTENKDPYLRIYIGRKNVRLKTGVYTYALTYRARRLLGFFPGHDELYFNVTGNEWAFPIDEASATVTLPEGVSAEAIGHEAYTGVKDAKGKDYESSVDGAGRCRFRATRPLAQTEGLTIVVTWPKGFVKAPTASERLTGFLRDNLMVLAGLAGLIVVGVYFVLAWVQVGRDPPKGIVIPLFEPPEGLSPAAVRFIRRMGFDKVCFAATVIGLAVKRHLTIEDDESGFRLVRTEDAGGAGLEPAEDAILGKLLGNRSEIRLTNTNHKAFTKARDHLKESLAESYKGRYFLGNLKWFIPGVVLSVLTIASIALLAALVEGNPAVAFLCVWLSFWSLGVFALTHAVISAWRGTGKSRGAGRLALGGGAIGITLFAVPFVVAEIAVAGILVYMTSIWLAPIMVLLGLVNVQFHHFLKQPTPEGREVMDRIEGFRMYLGTAEGDVLMGASNPPHKTPELFERFLPYALALGVETVWAEQLAEVLERASAEGAEYAPTWYHGRSWSTLGAGAFASSFSSSFSSALSSASTAPGSSSGSGGGGSSGGGGGGGGGGGW